MKDRKKFAHPLLGTVYSNPSLWLRIRLFFGWDPYKALAKNMYKGRTKFIKADFMDGEYRQEEE